MEETLIRGIVHGVVLVTIGIVCTLLWKLYRSPNEGARRIRWVLAALIMAFVLYVVANLGGSTAVVISLVGFVVVAWIYKGFKKDSAASSKNYSKTLPENLSSVQNSEPQKMSFWETYLDSSGANILKKVDYSLGGKSAFKQVGKNFWDVFYPQLKVMLTLVAIFSCFVVYWHYR